MVQAIKGLPMNDDPSGVLKAVLRYGENAPQVPAGRYSLGGEYPLALSRFKHVGGNQRSMVGETDTMSAIHTLTRMAGAFDENGLAVPRLAVGVKHGTSAGAAAGNDKAKVAELMINGHLQAIFGGVLAFNFVIDAEIATVLKAALGLVFGGVYAPGITSEAVDILLRKDEGCCIEVNAALAGIDSSSIDRTLQRIDLGYGEYILQPRSTYVITPQTEGYTVHGERTLEQTQLVAMSIGGALAVNATSNTVLLMQYDEEGNVWLIGMGAGQQDRVGAGQLAITRANERGHDIHGAVAISDSFFPATDGAEVLIEAGVGTIYATYGGKRIDEVIAACSQAGVTLVTVPDAVGRLFSKHHAG